MSLILRAKKLRELLGLTDYVQSDNDCFRIYWPYPRERQYARVERSTGKVLHVRVVRVSGEVESQLSSEEVINKLDRRINFLHANRAKLLRDGKPKIGRPSLARKIA